MQGWTHGRLKDIVATVRNGAWGEDPKDDGTDVRCVRAADFDRRRLRVKHETLPPRNLDPRTFKQHRLRSGDLILEKSGGGEQQPVGQVVLFDADVPAVCSNFCARMTTPRYMDPRFVNFAFSAAYSMGFTQAAIKQTTGIQNLDTDAFLGGPWAWPGLDEQRRIADFLDAETARIDRLVELRSSAVDHLTARRNATLGDLVFSHGGPSLTTLDPSPTNTWQVRALAHVLRQLTNGYVGPTRDLFVDESGVRYLQSLHIKNGRIDFLRRPYYVPSEWAAERPRITLRAGDLLIVQTGAIGEVALVDEEFAGASCHALLIARPNRRVLSSSYFYEVLRSGWGKQALLREQTGALHPHLEAGKVREIKLPVPDLDVQDRIAAVCASADAETRHMQALLMRQIDLMLERKQALITAAVTGKFDVTTGRGVDLS